MKNKIYIIIFSVIFSILIWGSITLSDQFYSSFDYKVRVINNPKNYTCGVINPQNLSIKLKAKGWQLLNLKLSSGSEFLVSAAYDSGLISVDAYSQMTENPLLGAGITIMNITPRNIVFNVEEIVFKKLKVEASTDLSFEPGYGLATPIRVYPDSILAGGPKSVIENMYKVKTNKVIFSSLDNKTKLITQLENLPGFEFQQNNVELTLDVQKIVENYFEGIRVTIKDIPSDRDIVLIPNTIGCSVRGGINIIGKVTADQILASINYKDIILDTVGSVKPIVNIPKNTQLLFTKPEQLEYIIKKF